jgi:EAL and modified HD-GYP domain-containing signal transduction protein
VRYTARLPILDVNQCVHGYELRLQMESEEVSGGNEMDATRTILDDAVIFGIDRLTGGLPGFVRCSADALTDRLVSVLPPALTVLEVSARLEVTPQLAEACRELKEAGFNLALVGFTGKMGQHPLLDLMAFVRVDVSNLATMTSGSLRQRLRGAQIELIADQVETQEDYRKACAVGFTLFQGYYFCRPELIRNAKVPSNRLLHFELLRQLNEVPLDLKGLCPLVARDASLTYRLLRLVNSPLYAVRQEVRSIESAILMLGDRTFHRIATLAIFSELNAQEPPEILHMALVRARFCEQAARLRSLDPNEQYLLGMFSLLPAMMRQPMEKLAAELPLRNEIRQALMGTKNSDGCLLAWIEAHERDDQAAREAIGKTYCLNQQSLMEYYLGALLWDASACRSGA